MSTYPCNLPYLACFGADLPLPQSVQTSYVDVPWAHLCLDRRSFTRGPGREPVREQRMGICVGMAAAACSLTQTKRDGGSAQISQSRGLLSEQAGCRSDSDAYLSFTLMVWGLDVTNLNYSLVGCTLGSALRYHQHYSQRKRREKSRDRARTSDKVKDEGKGTAPPPSSPIRGRPE